MRVLRILLFSLLVAAVTLQAFLYGWKTAYIIGYDNSEIKITSQIFFTCSNGRYIIIGDWSFRCLPVQKT